MTYVYIDGLNLYHHIKRRLRGRGKWLDLQALADRLVDSARRADLVRYFTARVAVFDGDPGPSMRQDVYLRALRTLPRLTIHFGTMAVRKKMVRLSNPPPGAGRFAEASIAEEKGSDVNLATHLVFDAARNRFDSAVVVTNDTDLAEPIRLVTTEVGKRITVVYPAARPAGTWRQLPEARLVRLWPETILKSQLPDPVPTHSGPVSRPMSWRWGPAEPLS
ncbi:MAG: NYN domain-containing protein, partial [Gemmatimonadetes bacterium]|nr:NYN domain-containing protein [Gemmatimonadota bacterium]